VKVIPRKEVESVEVSDRSVMPEGLANAMRAQDFRDLVRYLMANPFVSEGRLTNPQRDPTPPPSLQEMQRGGRHGSPVFMNSVSAPVSGRIPLRPTQETLYAFVEARVTTWVPFKTQLMLRAPGPLKVSVNGTTVYE